MNRARVHRAAGDVDERFDTDAEQEVRLPPTASAPVRSMGSSLCSIRIPPHVLFEHANAVEHRNQPKTPD